jgi:signal transduction histidine kinase
VLFANPAAGNLLDGVEINPVGRCIVDLVPSGFLPPNPWRALRDLHRHRVHIYELVAQQATYLCHVAELGRPRTQGWVVVLNDVTQLKELDRLKSQMVQMTSHDLKNPLQAMMSYVELLEEDGAGVFTEEMQDYLDIVWAQLDRMYRIISGILDLERVQSGTPAFDLCSLEEVLRRVADEMGDQAHAKGLDFQLEIDGKLPAVLGDSQLLGQAVTNLVENSIKFTPPGGKVIVRAGVNKRQLIVEVIDTGIGIPPEEQPRVFERFYRGQQQGLVHVTGSGLGLSLVWAIVSAHHGEISLVSELGKGTTFRVRLPVVAETDG